MEQDLVGVLGNKGTWSFSSREQGIFQGNKGYLLEGNFFLKFKGAMEFINSYILKGT